MACALLINDESPTSLNNFLRNHHTCTVPRLIAHDAAMYSCFLFSKGNNDLIELMISHMLTLREVLKLQKAIGSAADVLDVYLYDTDRSRANSDPALDTNCPTGPSSRNARSRHLYLGFTPVRPFPPFVLLSDQASMSRSFCLSLSLFLALRNISNRNGHKNEAFKGSYNNEIASADEEQRRG